MVNASEALERLQDGNRRFVAHGYGSGELIAHSHIAALIDYQTPFAIILGCSDSRVPAEIVFDQGLGDLFVIRVAGNIAAESQIGSIEYAATHFGTSLVLVMGHTRCGAVEATVDALTGPSSEESENIRLLADLIRPSVEPLVAQAANLGREELIHRAVQANVRRTVATLSEKSDVLGGLIRGERLTIVGAEYAIETGEVTFFDA